MNNGNDIIIHEENIFVAGLAGRFVISTYTKAVLIKITPDGELVSNVTHGEVNNTAANGLCIAGGKIFTVGIINGGESAD